MSTPNATEANKENVWAKPHRTQSAVKTDVPNHDDLTKNVTSANSVKDKEKELTNRICLHAPLTIADDTNIAVENADTSSSPGIFLEYLESEETPAHIFEREEREPTPFFKTTEDRKESEIPFFNQLQPLTPPGNTAFERGPPSFFDKAKYLPSYYLEDNSSSESSPDREMEAIEKPRSHFLTVPTKAAFSFEGPVRAPRDSTPTPFQGTESPSDPMLDNTAGLRPPRESTPFFPNEEDDRSNKSDDRESLHGSPKSSPGKDTSVGRNQSVTYQSKAKSDSPLMNEENADDHNKNTRRLNFDQVDRQKELSSEIAESKNGRGKCMNIGYSSSDKGKIPTFQARTTGNSQKASETAATQCYPDRLSQQGLNKNDNWRNDKGMLSNENKVSNLPRCFQQKPASGKIKEATSDLSMPKTKSAFQPIPLVDKAELPISMGQPSHITNETDKHAVQMSPNSNKQLRTPADAKTSDSSESSVAAHKAASAKARKELYRQRKLQADQAKGKLSSKEEATNSRSPEVNKGDGKGLFSPKPIFKLLQTPGAIANQQCVIQSSPLMPKSGLNRLTSMPLNQAATKENSQKLKSAFVTHESLNKLSSDSPANLNSSNNSISNANPQQTPLTTKLSELPNPAKLINSSATSTKTIRSATVVVKSSLPTPVSLAKASVLTSPISNPLRDKRSPSPKPVKDSFSRISQKPQSRIDSSNVDAAKNMELCKFKELPLPLLHPRSMYSGIQNTKPKTSPSRLNASVSTTATKTCNGNSRGEKGAFCMPAAAVKSSKATITSAPAQSKSLSNVLMATESTFKLTEKKGGEYGGDKNPSHLITKPSNSTQAHISDTRLCETSQQQQTIQQLLISPKPASLSSINPIQYSPSTGFQNRMPISHRLEVLDKNKIFTAAKKSSLGIVNEGREQSVTYSTLWSKLLKAFMNSFVNEVPLSKEETRKPPWRRKAGKPKDFHTSKGKSKVTREKSSDYDWTVVSPFGRYTLEGVFLACIMTLIALSAEVRVEVFICYILAAYYTFFVLRVLKILD